MKTTPGAVAPVLAAACLLAAAPSCSKKEGETVRADLQEAGYALTAEDWFRASRENDVTALGRFADARFPMETRDPAGDTALHAAAAAGAEDAARFLLDHRLPVDARGAKDRTPLMAAVIAGQTSMIRWLLRQEADPRLKDADGFKPIMLAVREGRAAAVAELAAYDRDDLDAALLLAALLGRPAEIDALTNYGASVYARMDDGRTPLMVAAENGHAEAVSLLLDIGASRFSLDPEGRTAADLAARAGHSEIAALISRDPLPEEFELETPEEIAVEMEEHVVAAAGEEAPEVPAVADRPRSVPLGGQTLSRSVPPPPEDPRAGPAGDDFPMPPLVMRHYREREMPVALKSVHGDEAVVVIAGNPPQEQRVKVGAAVPGTGLIVVRARRKMEDSKVSPAGEVEISVIEVRDPATGGSREWLAGRPATAHDPVALVEDAATGRRYLASPGQRFSGADGAQFVVEDVRPGQLIIKDPATGGVRTIRLRGPRG